MYVHRKSLVLAVLEHCIQPGMTSRTEAGIDRARSYAEDRA